VTGDSCGASLPSRGAACCAPTTEMARVCRVARGEAIEQVGFEEMDAIGNRMALGVAFGDGYGCEGNVGGVDCGATEFLGEGDGNAGGAGADIGDLQASPVSVCLRPERRSRTARRSRATSMTCSVSGRGINTSGVTSNSRPRIPVCQ